MSNENFTGKVIPILPCSDIRPQTEFYKNIGFELVAVYTSPNPYAVVRYEDIELNFYGTRKLKPEENASMCFVKVNDVDRICDLFTKNLKENTGKVPRTGIPRISKVRELSLDRRFTLTDAGGNTFYIGTPTLEDKENFFRNLENEEYRNKFYILYDLMYSKEDPQVAENMLIKMGDIQDKLAPLDRAKFLVLKSEINLALAKTADNSELKILIAQSNQDSNWMKIEQKFKELFFEQ